MFNTFDAVRARELANNRLKNSDIKGMLYNIRRYAKAGRYSIELRDKLTRQQVEKLNRLGFTVTVTENNGGFPVISWY